MEIILFEQGKKQTSFILNEPFCLLICIVRKEGRLGMLQMDTGWIVSLIISGFLLVLILAIAIPIDRKYVVRENGKINYKKTKIYLRWNVFDTLTLGLAVYSIICVQVLNFLVFSGETVENVFVLFFTNQAQLWTIVSIIYLICRVSMTLKAIKERWGDEIE
ncbi:group-specific protein [Lederbergia wuyishanensis]